MSEERIPVEAAFTKGAEDTQYLTSRYSIKAAVIERVVLETLRGVLKETAIQVSSSSALYAFNNVVLRQLADSEPTHPEDSEPVKAVRDGDMLCCAACGQPFTDEGEGLEPASGYIGHQCQKCCLQAERVHEGLGWLCEEHAPKKKVGVREAAERVVRARHKPYGFGDAGEFNRALNELGEVLEKTECQSEK